MFDTFSQRDLQNFITISITLEREFGGDLNSLREKITRHLADKWPGENAVVTSRRYRSDNIRTCSLCGQSAVIVPLSITDRSAIATHAIQCQNRPANDQPWHIGMCGHTEYIVVRGDE